MNQQIPDFQSLLKAQLLQAGHLLRHYPVVPVIPVSPVCPLVQGSHSDQVRLVPQSNLAVRWFLSDQKHLLVRYLLRDLKTSLHIY